jgi:hypothetical protein
MHGSANAIIDYGGWVGVSFRRNRVELSCDKTRRLRKDRLAIPRMEARAQDLRSKLVGK